MVTLVAAALTASRAASAEPYQLGALFGPRFFSDDAEIGAKETYRTTLESTVVFGPRLARPVLAWLVPELELPLAVTTTRDLDVTVLWAEPRAHLRFVWPKSKVEPFALLGGGAPMTASTKRGIFGSDISWEGYGGIGAAFSPGRGLSFRLDVRVGITDGFEAPIASEVELMVGMWFDVPRPPRKRAVAGPATVDDRDGDGVPDPDDRCPAQAEDEDQFQDGDGCPDIDNDLDQVLDIADACPTVPETFNGFQDDDGCQDTIPGDLAAVFGTIEGLLYNPGMTEVRDTAAAALDRIAEVLTKHRSVRLVLIGHTDDREAEIDDVEGESEEDRAERQAQALVALGAARAGEVRAALIARGIPGTRIVVVGRGVDDAVSDNDTPRGRLRNRRVELQLFVPVR